MLMHWQPLVYNYIPYFWWTVEMIFSLEKIQYLRKSINTSQADIFSKCIMKIVF